MTFTVTLNGPVALGHTVTMSYATSNLTAIAGTDYVAVSGSLTFNPGDTRATIVVPILDTSVSTSKTFRLTLSKSVGATLVATKGTATIAPPG